MLSTLYIIINSISHLGPSLASIREISRHFDYANIEAVVTVVSP